MTYEQRSNAVIIIFSIALIGLAIWGTSRSFEVSRLERVISDKNDYIKEKLKVDSAYNVLFDSTLQGLIRERDVILERIEDK